jgi:DNA invertase Pin-like site-specific DNA recombinase
LALARFQCRADRVCTGTNGTQGLFSAKFVAENQYHIPLGRSVRNLRALLAAGDPICQALGVALFVPYLRVSTSETQSVDSSGQLYAIAQWAAAAGHELTDPQADEGISGAHGPDRRPGLAAALALVARSGRRRRAGAPDGIVAYDRTRLCRDAALCGWLTYTARSGGWRLVTVDGFDSADGSDAALFEGAMQGVFGDLQRRAIGRATAKALQARKSAGHVYGHTPFGQRRGPPTAEAPKGVLVPEPEEQATLAYMRELAGQPGATATIVARQLNAARRLNRGRPWVRQTVQHLLKPA